MQHLDRRSLFTLTATAISVAPIMVRQAMAAPQSFDPKEAERILFPAPGLPGGGQMEVRMVAEGEHPDADIREIAHRLKPFNPESWHGEHARMAEKNEKLAAGFEADGLRQSAAEHYLRAAGFWRSSLLHLIAADPRMLASYEKLRGNHEKAWTLIPRPYERVEIPFDGQTLEGHFYAARGPAGQKSPVVFNYGGADGVLLSGSADGGSGQWRNRGLSYFNVDGPGQGGALRVKKIYATAESERYVKAVIDYLVTRADVDPARIGLHGSSMGGYCAPRAATVDKRIAAVAVWSGAYSLREDIYDYYPPIRERLRWLMGASNFDQAREMMAAYTLEGRAKDITCPLCVGYSLDDRVMDPRGALKLYNGATNAPNRDMVEGTGHGDRKFAVRNYLSDWMAKQLKTA